VETINAWGTQNNGILVIVGVVIAILTYIWRPTNSFWRWAFTKIKKALKYVVVRVNRIENAPSEGLRMGKELGKDLKQAMLQEIERRLNRKEKLLDINIATYMSALGYTDRKKVNEALGEIIDGRLIEVEINGKPFLDGNPVSQWIANITDAGRNYLASGAGLR